MKNDHKKKKRLIFFIFFVLIFVGLLLRLYLIINREIFTDEVFYWSVALNNSFGSLIQVNHWLKDHGPLFLIVLKGLQFFTKDIITLRLFNLPLYLINSGLIFCLFLSLETGFYSLIPVFIYSFYSYFVFINVLISPFNLVMNFFLWSFILALKPFLFNKKGVKKIPTLVLLSLTTVLAFYSDYTSIYLYLTLGVIAFFSFLYKKSDVLDWGIVLMINLFLITPGIIQLNKNFTFFQNLNPQKLSSLGFVDYLGFFANTVLARNNATISIAVIVLMLIFLLFFTKKEKRKLALFLTTVLLSFVVSMFFMLFFSLSKFSVFSERTFWFFYLDLVFAFGLIVYSFRRHFFAVLGLIVALSVLIINRYFWFSPPIPGSVPDDNIHYQELVDKIEKEDPKKTVYLIDKDYKYIPMYYYFSREKSLSPRKVIVKDGLSQQIINSDGIIVLFNRDENSLLGSQNKPFSLKCHKKECFFIKI